MKLAGSCDPPVLRPVLLRAESPSQREGKVHDAAIHLMGSDPRLVISRIVLRAPGRMMTSIFLINSEWAKGSALAS